MTCITILYYLLILINNTTKKTLLHFSFPYQSKLTNANVQNKKKSANECPATSPSLVWKKKKGEKKNHTHQTIHPARTAPTTTATAILGLTAPAPFSSSSGGEDGFGLGLPVVALGVGLLLLSVSVSDDEEEEAGPEEGFGRAEDGAAGGVVGLGEGLM